MTRPRNADGTFSTEPVPGTKLTYEELDAMAGTLARRVYERGSPPRPRPRESDKLLAEQVRAFSTIVGTICTLRKTATEEEFGPRLEALEEDARRRAGMGQW